MFSTVNNSQADTPHSNVSPCSQCAAIELHKWFACSRNNSIADDVAGPPVFVGESKEIGKYIVQYSATDSIAWVIIPVIKQCNQE
jgi:hypothetical protein